MMLMILKIFTTICINTYQLKIILFISISCLDFRGGTLVLLIWTFEDGGDTA
jgi:hypothetical protein